MARGNWASLAVDLDGKRVNGLFRAGEDMAVNPYKNWAYLEIGTRSVEVWEGHVERFPLAVYAKRGSHQQAVYVLALDKDAHPYRGMVAIGCYGYDENEPGVDPEDPWVWVRQRTIDECRTWLTDLIQKEHLAFSVPEIDGAVYP